jgi:phosphopentomutase
MLPADDPVLVDLQLGAMLYMKKAAVSFLGGGDPAKYAVELKFITDKGNVTEADIENFMVQGIAAAVDAEFGKVRFLLKNSRTNPVRSHEAVLAYSANPGYTLTYEGAYTTNGHQEITAPTLDALLAEMGRRKTDFDQTGINNVRAQAALIPATRLDNKAISGITDILTNLYLRPADPVAYSMVKAVFALYKNLELRSSDNIFKKIKTAYDLTLYTLSAELEKKVVQDWLQQKQAYTTLTTEQQRIFASIKN